MTIFNVLLPTKYNLIVLRCLIEYNENLLFERLCVVVFYVAGPNLHFKAQNDHQTLERAISSSTELILSFMYLIQSYSILPFSVNKTLVHLYEDKQGQSKPAWPLTIEPDCYRHAKVSFDNHVIVFKIAPLSRCNR